MLEMDVKMVTKMEMNFQNKFAFPYYFDAWKFQGRSYGDHKKILHEEMHEWKIAWRTSFLIAWKTSHFGSSFGRCLILIHGLKFLR